MNATLSVAIAAARDHINLFLYDGAIVPDPEGLITGGHHNHTARTIAKCLITAGAPSPTGQPHSVRARTSGIN